MNVIKMILKEAGGRFENAAGSINSKDNMFATLFKKMRIMEDVK